MYKCIKAPVETKGLGQQTAGATHRLPENGEGAKLTNPLAIVHVSASDSTSAPRLVCPILTDSPRKGMATAGHLLAASRVCSSVCAPLAYGHHRLPVLPITVSLDSASTHISMHAHTNLHLHPPTKDIYIY